MIDKATEMMYFLPCTSSVTRKETAQLFWNSAGCTHGITSTIISDHNVRFTEFFEPELQSVLRTGLRIATEYHPQNSRQLERYKTGFFHNSCYARSIRCAMDPLDNVIAKHSVRCEHDTRPLKACVPFFFSFCGHPDTTAQLLDQTIRSQDRISI